MKRHHRGRSSKTALLASLGCAGLVWLGAPRSASAQTRFGEKHQLAVGAENLFGFTTERFGQSPSTGDTSVTSTHFGLLFTGQREENVNLASPLGPQISGHFFIIPSLSLGGTIGYETLSASQTRPAPNGTLTTNLPDENTFLFIPKVGYVLSLSDLLGFWFRGGLGFVHEGVSGSNNPTSTSDTFWLFSADALFVVTPFQHFGFFVGPQANLSLSGSHSQTAANGVETSFSGSYRSFSIGTGLFGYVDL